MDEPIANEPATDAPLKGAFEDVPFDTRSEFQELLQEAIASAQRELCLADCDFSNWPVNSPTMEEALHRFLLASRSNKAHVIYQRPDFLLNSAPRFARLMRLFGDTLICKQAADHVADRFGQEYSFLIVDRARIVRRFHRDTMRGVAHTHPNETGPWVDRFFGVWEEAQPGFSATTLGL